MAGTPLVAAWPGAAVPLPPPLGACSGPQCPGVYPPPHNGDFVGRDASINVFVGGDYQVQGRAAEVEGQVVTLGSLSIAKNGGGAFNMSVVGVGSRVVPPDGTDFVTVGKGVSVAAGNTLYLGGSDSKTTAWGNLRYGTTATGTISIAPTGKAIHDSDAGAKYAGLRPVIERFSHCMAEQTATGTVTSAFGTVTFKGDGTSKRQVFNVPGDLGGPTSQVGLTFTGIPAGATVIVNMLSASPLINTYTGTGLAGDQLTGLRPKLMWNFPTSTTARITGGAQFQGSMMAGNPSGTTTISTPGMNGRVYLAGNLVQEGSGGYELHNYPFDGDLPTCDEPPPVLGHISVTKKATDTGRPLPGAVFQLWRESNGEAGLQTGGATPDTAVGSACTSGADGVCRAADLPLGSYYWQETKAPNGYELPRPNVSGPHQLTADNAERGVAVTVEDAPVPPVHGAIHVLKTDDTTHRPLPGAVFELWRETNGRPGLQTSGPGADTRTGPACATNDMGRCDFDGLDLGTYYVREVAVPEGYVLPGEPVAGPYVLTAENGPEGIELRLTNKRGEPDKGKGKGGPRR
ncbi:choice-of-anchor A family protein [Streptomyces sp. NPDC048696]|uniref:choice-of-anchor A family protein n=1 Tax=Streptomyces sp. NPDC048696 TaxID=3365585 RepID=UPI003712A0F7